MKYKALFLDLDGTILDTLKDIANAVNYSLNRHGLPTKTLEQIRSYIGKGSHYLIKKAMDDNPDKRLCNSVFNMYKDYYLTNFSVETTPYENMYEVLNEFKLNGGKVVLITNKPHDIANKLIEKFYPNIFDYAYGNCLDYPTKPDPTSCELAIKQLKNIAKEDILYIGDSLIDKLTAENAGLDYLLCNYGYANPGDIESSNHPYITNSNELRGYLY